MVSSANPSAEETADWTVNPPVMKFQFYITEPYISICSNKLTVWDIFQQI